MLYCRKRLTGREFDLLTYLVSWPGGSWEASLRIAATILIVYMVVLWIALVFWAYRDIRQRTRDPIIQMVAVLLVLFFFLPGHWVYLILRPRHTLAEMYERSLEEEALLQELEDQKACPSCKRRVHDDFLICPSCRTRLKEPCRSCAKPLSYAWLACPFCGLEKPPREGVGARPLRAPQPRPAVAAPAKPARNRQPVPAKKAADPFASSRRAGAATTTTDEAPVIDATE